jgi:hypothetical protein
MKNYRLVLISAACAVVFAGCSSGGGSSVPVDENVTGVQLDGEITKGIVVDGPVTIEELDSVGNAVRTVGTARTGSDGSYQATLDDNYQGGVLQVTITADASTRMKCDIPAGCGTRTDGLPDSNSTIDFGEFYKPSALTMTALLPGAENNAVVNASVTPFTHTAAKRARSQPTLDSAAVANANSEVSNLLGVDILNTAPVDITDATAVNTASSSKQVTYAALLSAIAMEANLDADDQPLLNDVLDQLASALISTTIQTADLQVIVDNTLDVLNTIGIADVTGIIDHLQYFIDEDVDLDGIIDFPPPSDTIDDSNLDKVKAMVSDIRTWGNVIIAEAGDKASAFSVEVGMASDAVGILGTSAFDALGAAIDAAFLFDGRTDLSVYNLDFPATPPNPRQFSSGQITSTTPGEIVITDGVFKGYTVNMTVLLPPDGAVDTAFTLGVTSATVVGSDNSLSIPTGTLDVTFSADYTINYALPNPPTDLADLIVALPNASFTQYKDSGGQTLANPVTFSGTMNADLDPIPVTNVSVQGDTTVLVLPKTMSLTGAISNGVGDSVDASLVANVTNTGSFQFIGDFAPAGTLYSVNHAQPFASWAYSDTDATPGDDTFTASYPGFSSTIYWDATTGIATLTVSYDAWFYSYPSYMPLGSLAEALAYFGGGTIGDIYAWVDDEGMYYASTAGADFTQDGTLDGTLVDPDFIIENANQWIDADVGLTFSLQLTGLPAASVNINADRTGFSTGQGSVTISYGSRQIEIAATVADNVVTTDYTGSVTITNQDGAKIVLDSLVLLSDQVFGMDDLSGVLLYNGIQYGTIAITSSGYLKVTYIDGTFEIF